jgi:hypothetical protein
MIWQLNKCFLSSPDNAVVNKIYDIRVLEVMLDSDLAELMV